MDVVKEVNRRYSGAAKKFESMLCCPAKNYDPKYLKVIPKEVIERDYGCGDPSPYVKPGDTVLDLGSGGGKLCFISSQLTGPTGKVIGVDMNDDMLALARSSAPKVAEKLGYANVEFRKGRIEDLALNHEKLDEYLSVDPINNARDLSLLDDIIENLKSTAPLIEDNSIDIIVSNCVLNLVTTEQKKKLFKEIYRVLKPNGRVVISDIISDEDVPEYLRNDPTLWSGCYSGAMREDEFINAFIDAGLHGVRILKRDKDPYYVMDGIELRSVTLEAYKQQPEDCWDHKQAVLYKGPFSSVYDDDGHRLERGMYMAVCEKTFNMLKQEPYSEYFEFLEPHQKVERSQAKPFPCTDETLFRKPSELKNSKEESQKLEEKFATCGPGCC